MNGFRKYLAKLLIVYIAFTSTFPTMAYASGPVNSVLVQPDANLQITPSPQDVQPITALPQHASRLSTSDSILALSNNDGIGRSAHVRTGVSVQKLRKKDFKADEDVTLTLSNPDQEKYKTKVVDAAGQEVKMQLNEEVQDGITKLQVIPTNQFQPGKYTISIIDETGKTTTQDFTWGVLALNPDRTIYAQNQTADFSMAVLDDKGKMVCDAQVSLTITDEATGTTETLSTANQKIIVNPECSSHAFTLKPDYEAHYLLKTVGKYALALTANTANGSRTITDEIRVQDSTPFDIQRMSATRIYPPNTYPMQFNITANKDFAGTITETVPDSFTITPANTNTSYDSMRTVYLNNNDPNAAISKQVLGASTGGLVMPFDGNFPITQGFGAQLTDPTLQALYSKYGLGGHDGIDFGLPMGTPLYAVDDGKIIWSGPGDYGTQVIIQHSWGKTYYGHMSKTSVNIGDDVHKGSLIGYSGMSGEATGPHLHFGMKPNNPDMSNGYAGKVNAMPYLPIGVSGLLTQDMGLGLPGVLGASTSAEATQSAILTPTLTPTPSLESTSASISARQDFTIEDAVSQQSAENQPQTMVKTKVIKWHVSLKKGENIKLSYNFKTPQLSPQFYLLGSLKFYEGKQVLPTFDEGRQWQIAADDIGDGWYHPAVNPNSGYEWKYREKLTIDGTKVPAAQSNFPVLVSMTDTNLKNHIGNNTVDTANDIVFTDSGGMNKISHEIETYNHTTGALVAWVNIPTLNTSTDTDFYMYYGNPSVGNQEDPAGTWSNHYIAVYHLSTGSCAGNTPESVSNTNVAVNVATPTNVTGQIGLGCSFNGSTQYINTNSTAVTLKGLSTVSVNAWVKPTTNVTQDIWAESINASATYRFQFALSGTGAVKIFGHPNDGASSSTWVTSAAVVTNNTWNFAGCTFVSTTTTTRCGVNSTYTSNTTTTNIATITNSNPFVPSRIAAGPSPSEFMNGAIDELEISNVDRGTNWLTTVYNNQSSPGTFIKTVAAEETKINATTNDMLMRHGKFWDSSGNNYGEQPFLF